MLLWLAGWPAWPLASPIFCMLEMAEAHQADVVGMVTLFQTVVGDITRPISNRHHDHDTYVRITAIAKKRQ